MESLRRLRLLLGGKRAVLLFTGRFAPDLLLTSRHRGAINEGGEGDWLTQACIREGHDPAGLARSIEANPVGVDLGMGADREHRAICIRGEQVKGIRAAVALRLTNATLVIRENRDPILDKGGDDGPVVQSRRLTAPMHPDHRGNLPFPASGDTEFPRELRPRR